MPRRRGRASSRSGTPARPEPRLRDLYAVPPRDFVAARDALARALETEGSPEAERVRRLRRPTASLWLLNAIARERPPLVQALLDAADRLRRSQARALAGHGAELRAAVAEMHGAVAAVLTAARELSAAGGREASAATLGEVERAVRGLATDVAAREALRDAVLDRLPKPGGAELLSGLAVVSTHEEPIRAGADATTARPAPRTPRPRRAGPDPHGAAAERAERARRMAERRRAEAAAEQRERAIAAAEARVRTAEARVRDATARLEEAQRRAAAARKDAEAARGEPRRERPS